MSDGWQKGDLALCIAPSGRWVAPGDDDIAGPKGGQILTVAAVEICPEGIEHLCFKEWPNDAFRVRYFRKVTPPAADAFDSETIRLLNGKPVREMA